MARYTLVLRMKDVNKSTVLGALIFLLTVLAYIPAMRAGFVFDDSSLITNNPTVKGSDGLHRIWFTTEAPDYYPLTWSLWWMEWRLWDARPMGYHVVNVLLHAVNAVLAWMILRKLKVPGAWVAALIFAIHPVNVATVAWISEQKNTLSMLFYLCAILVYLRFDEEGRWRWYGLSLGVFLLALLSKAAVVMLPVVLLGCVWWTRGRMRRLDLQRCVPFALVSAISAVVAIWFQYNRALQGYATLSGVGSRLALAGWTPWFYLWKALVPTNLMVIYPQGKIDSSQWASYLPGLILVGCVTLFWWKRSRWGRPLLFGIGYFVVMLLPVMGFFDQGFYYYSWVADHWQYYSIIGVIALIVAGGEKLRQRLSERPRLLATTATVVVLTLLGIATWRRESVYASDVTLWRDNLARNPCVWTHNNLANSLIHVGKVQEAMWHYERALRIDPDCTEAQIQLARLKAQAR
jgi:hypothetical protein